MLHPDENDFGWRVNPLRIPLKGQPVLAMIGILALAPVLNAATPAAAAAPAPSVFVGTPERVTAGLDGVAEFSFEVRADFDNPYDPEQIRVDADVSGPGGRAWVTPAFWYQPATRSTGTAGPDLSRVTRLRVFVASPEFRPGVVLEFAIDEIELSNSRTGVRRVLDDFEGGMRWQSDSEVTLAAGRDRPRAGASCLLVSVVNPPGTVWPGANLTLPNEDWSAYDTLRLSWRPIRGLENAWVRVEFVAAGRIVQSAMANDAPVFAEPRWRDFSWRFDRPPLTTSTWAAPGSGSWRVRLAVPVSGDYSLRLRASVPGADVATNPTVFPLERTDPDGFVRIDPRSGRFFQFDSGRPYVPIGVNLVGGDPARYDYYLPKFAAAGVNLARLWLSARELGIERGQPTVFDQQRAAALDEVVNLGAGLGVRLMLCLSDFREALGGRQGYWGDTAYSRLSPAPEDFFTSPQAAQAYRKRLRYIVARWSASSAVQSWELFNEADLTSAWERHAGSVREWHQAMAGHLQGIDPYRHPVTTSFAGREDDSLWAQPQLQIVQLHSYPGRLESLAENLRGAVRTLAAHGKPVLVGEFGTHATNFYGDADALGLGLHEGLWAPLFAGAAGSGMSWWWEWVDRYELYPRFAAVSEFVRGLAWHEEGFAAVDPGEVEVVCDPADAAAAPERAVVTPVPGSFEEAPYNRPVTVRVRGDGVVEPPGLISRLVHGVRHHRGLHNPQTYTLDFAAAGEFAVCVASVSGHGGAALQLTLDGAVVLQRRFVDADGMLSTESLTADRGCYGIAVPAGKHTVVVENTGKDWFTQSAVTLTNYVRPRASVDVMAARGRAAVILWARNGRFSWFAPIAGLAPVPARNARATVRNVPAGEYLVELFDPQAGRWLERRRVVSTGRLDLTLGDIASDVAVRCTRL